MSLSRNATDREFQRHGPATEKLPFPRCVPVLIVAHVKTSADRSDRRPFPHLRLLQCWERHTTTDRWDKPECTVTHL